VSFGSTRGTSLPKVGQRAFFFGFALPFWRSWLTGSLSASSTSVTSQPKIVAATFAVSRG
jgi:predicted branched-subunit amino acid permease